LTGKRSLAELFDDRSQLITYHFMFDPDWEEGCKSCSFIADHYEPAITLLHGLARRPRDPGQYSWRWLEFTPDARALTRLGLA
jgi:predicted dithiol-disulfide oxidoreductase (DUF899 family)